MLMRSERALHHIFRIGKRFPRIDLTLAAGRSFFLSFHRNKRRLYLGGGHRARARGATQPGNPARTEPVANVVLLS